MYVYNHSTWKAEAGGSQVQGYLQLHSEGDVSPGQPGLHGFLFQKTYRKSVLMGELEDDFWGLKPVLILSFYLYISYLLIVFARHGVSV